MTVTIQTKNGPVEVECFATDHPSVVVHHTQYDGEAMTRMGFFGITHVPSGYAFMNSLPNREVALLAANWIVKNGEPNLDGDKDTITKSATKEFKRKIKIMRELIDDSREPIQDIIRALTGEDEDIWI